MKESWHTWAMRWGMNFFPCYRGTGARCTFIAHNWKEVHIKLPLNWRTRNYVGTIFGGSIYAAVDPMYMLMMIHILGPDYVVWDKSAVVHFRRPGRSTLYAQFHISNDEIETVKKLLSHEEKVDRHYEVELKDAQGEVHARVEKILHFSKKANHKASSASDT